MSYKVEFSRQGEKDLRRLDKVILGRLRTRIDELAQDPFNPRISRQMETDPNRRYSRVGDWRIVFQVIEEQRVIEVSIIQHRSRVYKELKR